PDMRVPIQYALTYPERVQTDLPRIDFFIKNSLTFERPKKDKFPCLELAFKAIKTGGTMPAVLNAANEIAVGKFIERKIKFTDIPKLIEKTMNAYTVVYDYTLDDVLAADKWARTFASETEVL
ncbi:MAG: 1-deoxy-D-xylulose-5-phosphate reductoisomerase, partial [Firmicutes bacterium]|nr:1-deoxy-D-xylulose-5-phosphate reductoisomerase [Bacillota bacterium]